RHWSEALQRRDPDAIHAMLTESARRAFNENDVRQVLARDGQDLLALAQGVSAPGARVETHARVVYPEERAALLVWEDGDYRIEAAGALPARADSPADALQELRAVLLRRSFPGLLRILTRDAAQSTSALLNSMLDALVDPASAEIEVDGRRATAHLPGGHVIKLEREDGTWRIRDID
ncbi:MAG TPA: hypothetical protein VG963_02930, partial [Polyangiaceae bacterium]|nr:hypothetical protein [Polyangiaceae bacterium]